MTVRVFASSVLVVVVTSIAGAQAPQRYRNAAVSAQGDLVIVPVAGKPIVIHPESAAHSFDDVRLSSRKEMVGWISKRDWYPTALFVFANGKATRMSDDAPPVWNWAFRDNDRRVAMHLQTLHFSTAGHYELRALPDGGLVELYQPRFNNLPDGDLCVVNAPPAWVLDLQPNFFANCRVAR